MHTSSALPPSVPSSTPPHTSPPLLEEALAASPLRVLTDEQKKDLLQASHCVSLSKGQRIFDEGDTCLGFYLMVSGMVKIYHLTAEGKEVVLHLIRPGNCFGEAFVFRQGDYPMSASCVDAGSALFIPAELMRRLTRANADLAESMLTMLATRLYMFTRKLQSQSLREAPQRLAAYVLHLSRMRGHSPQIQLDMSREMLANMLGTARETISRMLTRLVDRQVLRVQGRHIDILDGALLQRIAEGQEEL